MTSPRSDTALDELLASIDALIAILRHPGAQTELGGSWTVDEAERCAAALQAFRGRIEAGTPTPQDRTMSWARAFDWEGHGFGRASQAAVEVDLLRHSYFAET